MRDAEASALRFQNGFPLSILDGVPVAVKDELFVKGYRTWSGTSFIGADIPTADATIVHRLRALGAIIIGKTNMQEIGIGVTGASACPLLALCCEGEKIKSGRDLMMVVAADEQAMGMGWRTKPFLGARILNA